MPSGPQKAEALKRAGLLRKAADTHPRNFIRQAWKATEVALASCGSRAAQLEKGRISAALLCNRARAFGNWEKFTAIPEKVVGSL
jgi:hypothetical protein